MYNSILELSFKINFNRYLFTWNEKIICVFEDVEHFYLSDGNRIMI